MHPDANSEGLICAFHIDPKGKARPLDWEDIYATEKRSGWTWVHINRRARNSSHWLKTATGLDPNVVRALLSDENRPRCDVTATGMLLILRGVNLNPDQLPEDMVSIRLWIEPTRVISSRSLPILAINDIREAYLRGDGPETIGDLLVNLANGLVIRMRRVINELDEQVDEMEAASDEILASEARSQLLHLRRRAILLRRYILPQRETLTQLAAARTTLFSDFQRSPLREAADRITRLIEDLDGLRERAAVVQDEVSTRLAEQMNTTMYRLSIVATIFLPLSLFTGLLGINVGGIPGTEWGGAFWLVCAMLVVMTGVTLWLIKQMGRR